MPEKGDANDGVMAKHVDEGCRGRRNPTAFVVKDGKIAWIGHPMSMDEPLAKIVAGDWDATAMAKERLVAKTKERKVNAVRGKIFNVYRTGDYKAALATIEETTSGDAELAEEFALAQVRRPLQAAEAPSTTDSRLGGKTARSQQ